MKNSFLQSNNILSRLGSLSPFELRTLLTKYFEKVIDLREGEKKKDLQCSSLEVPKPVPLRLLAV